MSEYLHDQDKRTRLLDYLASLYESIADFSAELLTLEHGGLTKPQVDATIYDACTYAMDIQADWEMVSPMLHDIYGSNQPVNT